MAVVASDQAQGEGDLSPAQSADSFPKSHQILLRDFSNASTLISDADLSRDGSTAASRLKDLEGIPNGNTEKPDTLAQSQASDAQEASIAEAKMPEALGSKLSDLSTLAVQGSTATELITESISSNLADVTPEVQAKDSLAKGENLPEKQAGNLQEEESGTDATTENQVETPQESQAKEEVVAQAEGSQEPKSSLKDASQSLATSTEVKAHDTKPTDANSNAVQLPSDTAKTAADEVKSEVPQNLKTPQLESSKPVSRVEPDAQSDDAGVLASMPNGHARDIQAEPEDQVVQAQHTDTATKEKPSEKKLSTSELVIGNEDVQSQQDLPPSMGGKSEESSVSRSAESQGVSEAKELTSEQKEGHPSSPDLNDSGSTLTFGAIENSEKQDQVEAADSHDAKSELNPVCEPFVPCPQTPTRQEDAKPTRGLNANATEFTPSGSSSYKTTPSDGSQTEQAMWPPMQFGDLPESLAASPHQSIASANPNVAHMPEWTAQKYASYAANGGQASNSDQQGDWQEAWNGGYPYNNYYTDSQGYSYAMQPDGSWVPCWNQQHWGGDSQWGYSQASGDYDYEQEGTGPENGPRTRHRTHDRRRGGRQWGRASDTALVHILAKQFQHCPELISSVLELHDGSMKGTLDMLGQLEAESNGQLLTDQQDAPELNEENFPSLATPGEESGPATSLSKAGFANAVKASTPTADATQTADSPTVEDKPAPPTPSALNNVETTRSWGDEAVEDVDVRSQAQAKIEYHIYHRDESFDQAVWAAVNRDEAAATYWAEQGKQQSDLLIAACVEAEQALYKHRSVQLKRRRARTHGPIDLVGLSEKEALNTLEEAISQKTQLRQRNPRSIEHSFYVLFGSQKGSKVARGAPQSIEEWIKATQTKHAKKEPGFIELFV